MNKIICIVCPKGCQIVVEMIDNTYHFSNNECPRGAKYALNELTHPTRILTTTIPIKSKIYTRLPIVSNKPIAKEKLMECMTFLNDIETSAPIIMNEVIVKNILNTGIDMIASKTIKE